MHVTRSVEDFGCEVFIRDNICERKWRKGQRKSHIVIQTQKYLSQQAEDIWSQYCFSKLPSKGLKRLSLFNAPSWVTGFPEHKKAMTPRDVVLCPRSSLWTVTTLSIWEELGYTSPCLRKGSILPSCCSCN